MKNGIMFGPAIAGSVAFFCFPVEAAAQCDPSLVHVVDRMDDLSSWAEFTNTGLPTWLDWGPSSPDSPSIELHYEIRGGDPPGSWWAVMESVDTYDMSYGDLVAVSWKGDVSQYDQDPFGGTAYNTELSILDPTLRHWAISRSHMPAFRWFLLDKRIYFETDWTNVQIHLGVNALEAGLAGLGTISLDTIGTIDSCEARQQYWPSCLGRTSCQPGFAAIRNAAEEWIGDQQCASGFLKSWFEEAEPRAYAYSQAMGLRVLTRSDPVRAMNLVVALRDDDRYTEANGQRNGLWPECWNCDDLESLFDERTLIGANGTIIRALAEYLKYYPASAPDGVLGRLMQAADGLIESQDDGSGCIAGFEVGRKFISTEGNWNAYMGLAELADVPGLCRGDRERYHQKADEVLACLTRAYPGPDGRPGCWDARQGRWYAGLNSTTESPDVYDQPDYASYLDANTLGAVVAARSDDAELRAMAKSALAFVRLALGTSDCDWPGCDMENPILGLDSGGPYLPWNEGTLQYLVAAGCNSQSDVFLDGILQQIGPADDPDLMGSLPGSVADFRAGVVWQTAWHGVDPTAWLYFALRSSYSDFDSDCDVDLIDYASFHDCLAGPGTAPDPTPPTTVRHCLDAFDRDNDAHVDLQDFAGFQRAFTTP